MNNKIDFCNQIATFLLFYYNMLFVVQGIVNIPKEYDFGVTNKPELRQKLIIDKLPNKTDILVDKHIDKFFLSKIHNSSYLHFLENAYTSYNQAKDLLWGVDFLIPQQFCKKLPRNNVPLYKFSGYYCSDTMTPITKDTFNNAMLSAQQAYISANLLLESTNNNDIFYVAASSPGHHAKYGEYGGYCFLNNAMIAAYTLSLSNKKVAILDLDYHAGNGAAEMVQNNPNLSNIIACSLHCDPKVDYPSFEGYEDDFDNKNIYNFVLEPHTNIDTYLEKLEKALSEIIPKIDNLIIAFGGDTFKDDPDASSLGRFNIDIPDYHKIGQTIRKHYQKQLIITQEGGYEMDCIAEIVNNFIYGLSI